MFETLKSVTSYLGGFFLSTAIASPAEWMVHRYMLHPKSRNILNRSSGISHNDVHHGAYNGPEHYYRDMTNTDETIHFSPKWVGLIHAVSAGLGLAAYEGVRAIPFLKPEYDGERPAFVAGFLTGVGLYYAVYEGLHHHMHDIGKRRHAINTVFGNQLQEVPDGKLRFSKPTLDELCNHVEARIDSNKTAYDAALIEKLATELQYNATESHHARAKGEPSLKQISTEDALELTVHTMRTRESTYRESLSSFGRAKCATKRFLHRQMRTSSAFNFIDDHHFVHHFQYYKNLNVVLPLADVLLRTEVNCSKARLRNEKSYWICPNSPDVEKFVLEKELIKQEEMLAGQKR